MGGRRPASAPPELPGFEHVSVVGSGGFSDVFLYQGLRPRRRVAVKVLLAEHLGDELREAFEAEADLMATLSGHPSIVTMHGADVTADGRPYLVMEYCPRPSFGARYRRERLPLPDVLRVGVQVAGALETAHRHGILHRDVKPANILVTGYGHPALTDFGIASRLDGVARSDGMSIPWSPPESFMDPPQASVGTDVWGLGATVYSLLASRTPFEVPGEPSTSADLVSRIERSALHPTGRADVPASLEQVLQVAMAKDPRARYPAALDLARALQQVQAELALPVTPIDLFDQHGHTVDERPVPMDEVGTRLRPVVSIDPRGAGGAPAAPAAPPPVVLASELDAQVQDTVHRSSVPSAPAAPDPHRPSTARPAEPGRAGAAGDSGAATGEGGTRRRRAVVAGVGAAAALALAAVVTWTVASSGTEADAVAPSADVVAPPGGPVDNLTGIVPPVADLSGAANDDDTVTFSWSGPPDPEGDRYGWRVPEPFEDRPYQQTDETSVTVDAPGAEVCLEVVTIRDGAFSESRGLCVP